MKFSSPKSILILTVLMLNFFLVKSQPLNKKPLQKPADELSEIFAHPPESAKPGVLWMWMGSNVEKANITRDLEALKQEGFNRTTMFSLADVTVPWSMIIGKSPTPQIISWTEPWWKLVRFATEESKRLGMDFGMFNGSGYESSGGPWITPELSMQQLCWSSQRISSGTNIVLEKPVVDPHANTQYPVYNLKNGLVEKPVIEARKTFYRDIAVLAVPATGIVAKNKVINLTDKMQPDGKLNWVPPAGEWTVYRFGHTTMGALIQPAQPQATGLECDKMSVEAVSFHMNHIISELQKHLGSLVGTAFTHVHFDSYEAGDPTWTPKMREEFLKRRGYDLTPFLAVFAGRCIEGQQDTLQFKKDFASTIKDLYRDVYFATVSKKLKDANLVFLCEPYGGPWRQQDVIPLVGRVMTEFWTDKGVYSPFELEPTVNALRKSGQNIIEAEAFTGQPMYSKWSEYPAWLKPIGDAAFCAGVNRMVLHRFTHQPWDDRYLPGATMGQWGTHFDRTQTWWKPAKAMVQYWQRCQALLQWGRIAEAGTDDFTATKVTDSLNLKFIHRVKPGIDVYFVANTARHAGTAECSFKTTGFQPELWDPVTGETQILKQYTQKDGKTYFNLAFDYAQSFFVVFKQKATGILSKGIKNFPAEKEILRLKGSWQVTFDQKWGGSASPVQFSTLQDWTLNPAKGIKYYSGMAVYHTSFSTDISVTKSSKAIYLDLGKVNYIARVKLNQKDLGVIWTAPWRVKIPAGLLKSKNNELSVEVTNTWANRLIGDEQEPADMEFLPGQYYIYSGKYLKEFPDWFLNKTPRPSKGRYCFTYWNYFDQNSPLMPSGLLGPVKIISD